MHKANLKGNTRLTDTSMEKLKAVLPSYAVGEVAPTDGGSTPAAARAATTAASVARIRQWRRTEGAAAAGSDAAARGAAVRGLAEEKVAAALCCRPAPGQISPAQWWHAAWCSWVPMANATRELESGRAPWAAGPASVDMGLGARWTPGAACNFVRYTAQVGSFLLKLPQLAVGDDTSRPCRLRPYLSRGG